MLLLSLGAVIGTRGADKTTNKDSRHPCIMQVFAEGGDPSNSYTKPNVHKDRLLLLLAVTSLMACRCVCVCKCVCVCTCVFVGGVSFALAVGIFFWGGLVRGCSCCSCGISYCLQELRTTAIFRV